MGVLFGTDGVRGVANRELTPELAYKLGRAGAYVLSRSAAHPQIVIGKDTRVSGDMLEAALVAGICSVGADAWRVGVLPTPAVAYLSRTMGATAGAVISASHNPFPDNGIKFFAGTGYKLPDAVEEEIEEMVRGSVDQLPHPTGSQVGRVREVADAADRYVAFARETAGAGLDGLKIVVDCANGAAFRVAPQALAGLGAKVIALHDRPDGININDCCGSTHPESLQRAVAEHGADLGLAFDGDADRLLAVDARGNLVDGDQIMVACALHLKRMGRLANDTVVATVMSNLGLFLAMRKAGITVKQTKVGDRYVLEEMVKTGAVLGGEQSGHIIFLDHNTTGDGLITALQLLGVMVATGRSLEDLAAQMAKLPQVLVNVHVKDKEKVMQSEAMQTAVSKAEAALHGEGRVLVRPSGTEPLVRIMAEGPDKARLEELVNDLAGIAERI